MKIGNDTSDKRVSSNDALCCCEYFNINGERSHILAMFCDCEIVDSICDRILKRQEIPKDKVNLLQETIEDRCRIPWFTGAVKVNPANLAPILLLPISILFASNGPLCTLFSFVSLPLILIFINRFFNRHSKMFMVLMIVSTIFCFLVFMALVGSLRRLLLWELLLFLTMFCICVKQTIKLILSCPGNPQTNQIYLGTNYKSSLEDLDINRVNASSENIININNLKMSVINMHSNDSNACKFCNKIHEIERSGFCYICNECISMRDHHCIWIDNCIGEKNHKLFVYCLGMGIIMSTYGLHLAFTSICTPVLYAGWFLVPNDCRFVYTDYMYSIVFTTAIYVSIFLTFLIIIFLHQLILISQNLTMHEWKRVRHKQLTTCYLFLHRQLNPYSLGFFQNWNFFLAQKRNRGNYFNLGV